MLRIFNFENRFASIVKETVERLLDENDLAINSVAMQPLHDAAFKDSPHFFIMTKDDIDEGLAGDLIRSFNWPSVGVEIPVETKDGS